MEHVKKRRKRVSVLPMMILALIALLAVLSALYIINAQNGQETPLPNVGSQEGKISPVDKEEEVEPPMHKPETEGPDQAVIDLPAGDGPQVPSGKEEEEKPTLPQGVVPKGGIVSASYFDDAVFIGDSLTQGLDIYAILPGASYIASQGINPQTIHGSIVLTDGRTVTVLEELARVPHKKIYIMLGSNGIAWMSKETIVSYYGQFLDAIKEAAPDSTIFIQSILPVTQGKSQDERYANSKIEEYNEALLQMAQDKSVCYLNVAEALKNENGALPDEASPSDGMHMSASYYQKWADYLMCHTLETGSEKDAGTPETEPPGQMEPEAKDGVFSKGQSGGKTAAKPSKFIMSSLH